MSVVNGVVAFADLDAHEIYNGQSTGKFSLVLTLEDTEAEKLEKNGIKLKMYKNQAQRKFTTKFEDFAVIDNEGEPVSRASVRYGDKVRVKYDLGNEHPVHGVATYLQAVRVIEKGVVSLDDDGEF